MAKAKKRKQAGKVVRLGEAAFAKLSSLKGDDSWNSLILGVLEKLEAKAYWLVPSAKKVFPTRKEAMGFTVLKAVKQGKEQPERPIKVREDA